MARKYNPDRFKEKVVKLNIPLTRDIPEEKALLDYLDKMPSARINSFVVDMLLVGFYNVIGVRRKKSLPASVNVIMDAKSKIRNNDSESINATNKEEELSDNVEQSKGNSTEQQTNKEVQADNQVQMDELPEDLAFLNNVQPAHSQNGDQNNEQHQKVNISFKGMF